jgi:FdhD protein
VKLKRGGITLEPIEVKREIIRYGNGPAERIEDSVVTEHPVTLKINGTEFATLVCSPDFIEDLVIGFLASEGVIRKYDELDEIWIEEKSGTAHVKTKKVNPYYLNFQGKRYITSCCGAGRQGFVFINDALTAKNGPGSSESFFAGLFFTHEGDAGIVHSVSKHRRGS